MNQQTKEEILKQLRDVIPWYFSCKVDPYILEAMEIYSKSQTEPLLKRIGELEGEIERLKDHNNTLMSACKQGRIYFGENDKTMAQHIMYEILDNAIKSGKNPFNSLNQ